MSSTMAGAVIEAVTSEARRQGWALDASSRRQIAVGVDDALREHSELKLEPLGVAAHLTRVFGARPPDAALQISDLLFVWACAEGQAFAQAALSERFLPDAISSLGASAAERDELLQRLRVVLLVSSERPERILEYKGRGPLSKFLRAVAQRTLLNLRRGTARSIPLEPEHEQLLGHSSDPELSLLRVEQRGPFRSAFKLAFSSLDQRQRELLLLHYSERLSTEQIARMFEVHRVSVSRWLSEARRVLRERTREHLGEAMEETGAELDSLLRLADSQLEISLRGRD